MNDERINKKMDDSTRIKQVERINQRQNHLLATNIKRLRVERELRNCDIVCKLQLQGIEISSSTYSKVEAGKHNPTVDMIMALAQVYQCKYEEFFRE